jgi:xanthosine utilization system XapX-like protein
VSAAIESESTAELITPCVHFVYSLCLLAIPSGVSRTPFVGLLGQGILMLVGQCGRQNIYVTARISVATKAQCVPFLMGSMVWRITHFGACADEGHIDAEGLKLWSSALCPSSTRWASAA